MPQSSQHWLEWQGARIVLRAGQVVSIGRSRSADIRLPTSDLHVSGRAADVHMHEHSLEIENTSQRRRLLVRPPAGSDIPVLPLTGWSSRGRPRFSIVFPGIDGTEYVIAAAGPSSLPSRPRVQVEELGRTMGGSFPLSTTEHAMLAELCRPILTGRGAAASSPATYAVIADALDTTPAYVRKRLGQVRERLEAEGTPGFERGTAGGPLDHRRALADYAIDNGWVSFGGSDR